MRSQLPGGGGGGGWGCGDEKADYFIFPVKYIFILPPTLLYLHCQFKNTSKKKASRFIFALGQKRLNTSLISACRFFNDAFVPKDYRPISCDDKILKNNELERCLM